MSRYILAVDQSTSGTKALLFDAAGNIVGRSDLPHRQKISALGWVAHDPMEIYNNTVQAVQNLIAQAPIDKADILALAISNQRETALVWDRDTGLPLYDAIVWQCARGAGICARLQPHAEKIRQKTGLHLSPYYSAAKIAWVLENIPGLDQKKLCAGTIDSWLLFKLTGGKSFCTEYANASRTQLFNITELCWDQELCTLFHIEPSMLPAVRDSNAFFGETDFEGLLPKPIPILCMLGDSQGALYGQGCQEEGMMKASYGTGSSVMMNIGNAPVLSDLGLVTSIAWGMSGNVQYVLEGNVHYSGAVIKWVVEDLKLLASAKESGIVAAAANPEDTTYLVPAFTGLGAPHWKSDVKACLSGMTRQTGRAEIVKAAEECIAYQILDVIELMQKSAGVPMSEVRVDGGATKDKYLMQFQSDMLRIPLRVPQQEELSAIGVAYAAGIQAGLYTEQIFAGRPHGQFLPKMPLAQRNQRYEGWKKAVKNVLASSEE